MDLYLNEEEAIILEEIVRCTYLVADEYNKLMDMEVNGKSVDSFNLDSLKEALEEEKRVYLVFKNNSSYLFSILDKLEELGGFMETTYSSLASSSCIIDRIVSNLRVIGYDYKNSNMEKRSNLLAEMFFLKIMSIYSKIYDDIKGDMKLRDRKSLLFKKYDSLFGLTICESYLVDNNFDFMPVLEEFSDVYGEICNFSSDYFYEIFKATIDDVFLNITDENYENLSFNGELLSHYIYLRSILVLMDDESLVNARKYFDLVFNSFSYASNYKYDKNKKHIGLIEKAFDEVSSDKVRYRDKN